MPKVVHHLVLMKLKSCSTSKDMLEKLD